MWGKLKISGLNWWEMSLLALLKTTISKWVLCRDFMFQVLQISIVRVYNFVLKGNMKCSQMSRVLIFNIQKSPARIWIEAFEFVINEFKLHFVFFIPADLQTVDLNADSSASEVKQWLKSKGFSERFVVVPNQFKVLIWQNRRNVEDTLRRIDGHESW